MPRPKPAPVYRLNSLHHDANKTVRDNWTLRCTWPDCLELRFSDTSVCADHALYIWRQVNELYDQLKENRTPTSVEPEPLPQPYVYYLMVGPSTVKIGHTTCLPQRMGALRTDIQYVVAVEHGDGKLERQRHKQFAEERIGRREDFRLSDNLKRHIETLMPSRDDLIKEATAVWYRSARSSLKTAAEQQHCG